MINRLTLIGNLGGDPELRTLENGTQVARFSIATSESYNDKAGGWITQTEWHNIVVWRELAERCAANLKKGSKAYVDGKVTYRKYTDKDGVERNATEVVANVVRSLEKKEVSEGVQYNSEGYSPATVSDAPPVNRDDLPF